MDTRPSPAHIACRPFLVILLLLLAFQDLYSQLTITRLNNNQPIITRNMPVADANMNGPSLVRIPDWLPHSERIDSSANYYLYFASHWGVHIKMAWSENIDGPYTIYNPGKGVFHLDHYEEQLNLTLDNHIASPDVHVDHKNKRFILYFHVGNPIWEGDTLAKQKTVVATSRYGTNFNTGLLNAIICPFYARIFEYDQQLYALTKEGIFRAGDPLDPWGHNEDFNNLNPHLWRFVANPFRSIQGQARHFAVLPDATHLHVMYSSYPSSPEHIEYTKIELHPRHASWKIEEPLDVLFPEFEWEGYHYPVEPSAGGLKKDVHELRDPDLFRDVDGKIYLLYTGAGESEIGIARVDGLTDTMALPCLNSINIFPNPNTGNLVTISGIDRKLMITAFTPSGHIIQSDMIEDCDTYQMEINEGIHGMLFISLEDGMSVCWYKIVLI